MKRVACLALLLAGPALAQEGAPQQLEDVVVTAQKTAQMLEEVPMSVTAVDGAFMDRTGSNDLGDLPWCQCLVGEVGRDPVGQAE